MQNRQHIIKEYFELQVYLSRANQYPNEKVKFSFSIDKDNEENFSFFALAENDSFFQKLLIATKKFRSRWRPVGVTPFSYLEDHCCSLLQKYFDAKNIEKSKALITNELRSLGIREK